MAEITLTVEREGKSGVKLMTSTGAMLQVYFADADRVIEQAKADYKAAGHTLKVVDKRNASTAPPAPSASARRPTATRPVAPAAMASVPLSNLLNVEVADAASYIPVDVDTASTRLTAIAAKIRAEGAPAAVYAAYNRAIEALTARITVVKALLGRLSPLLKQVDEGCETDLVKAQSALLQAHGLLVADTDARLTRLFNEKARQFQEVCLKPRRAPISTVPALEQEAAKPVKPERPSTPAADRPRRPRAEAAPAESGAARVTTLLDGLEARIVSGELKSLREFNALSLLIAKLPDTGVAAQLTARMDSLKAQYKRAQSPVSAPPAQPQVTPKPTPKPAAQAAGNPLAQLDMRIRDIEAELAAGTATGRSFNGIEKQIERIPAEYRADRTAQVARLRQQFQAGKPVAAKPTEAEKRSKLYADLDRSISEVEDLYSGDNTAEAKKRLGVVTMRLGLLGEDKGKEAVSLRARWTELKSALGTVASPKPASAPAEAIKQTIAQQTGIPAGNIIVQVVSDKPGAKPTPVPAKPSGPTWESEAARLKITVADVETLRGMGATLEDLMGETPETIATTLNG